MPGWLKGLAGAATMAVGIGAEFGGIIGFGIPSEAGQDLFGVGAGMLAGTLHVVRFGRSRAILCCDSATTNPRLRMAKMLQAGKFTVCGASGLAVFPLAQKTALEVMAPLTRNTDLQDRPLELAAAVKAAIRPLMAQLIDAGGAPLESGKDEFGFYAVSRSVWGMSEAVNFRLAIKDGAVVEDLDENRLHNEIIHSWSFSLGLANLLPPDWEELIDPDMEDSAVLSQLDELFVPLDKASDGLIAPPLAVAAIEHAGVRWLRNPPLVSILLPDEEADELAATRPDIWKLL